IHHVDVDGNGESIYYALQEEEKDLDSLKLKIVYVSGMNKMICSNMKINFLNGKVDNFTAYVKPAAQFVPPHEIRKEEERLKGFLWRAKEKPVREDVVKTRSNAPQKKPLTEKRDPQRLR
ncbi:MAG TPA: hypothetical protein VF473_03910, partial [Cyclobacteriaceae bacterium]